MNDRFRPKADIQENKIGSGKRPEQQCVKPYVIKAFQLIKNDTLLLENLF